MAVSAKVIGTFDSDERAGRCIRRLRKYRMPPVSISVAGAHSELMRVVTAQMLKTHEQSEYMLLLGCCGAVTGAILAICASFACPGWFMDFGLLRSLVLGAVLGCMSGTLTGALVGSTVSGFPGSVSNERLPEDKVLISVDVKGGFRQQAVTTIMEDCGAVALLTKEAGS